MRNYDDESHNFSHPSDDSMEAPAKVLFAQLDKDGDGYLLRHLYDVELLQHGDSIWTNIYFLFSPS